MQLYFRSHPGWPIPLSWVGLPPLALLIVWALAPLSVLAAGCRPLDDLDHARAGNRPEPGSVSSDANGTSNAGSSTPPPDGAAGPDAAANVDSSSLLPGEQPSALPGPGLAADAAPEDASTRPDGSDSDPQPTRSRGELEAPDGLDAGEAGAAPLLTPAALPDAA
jgi:hypothetical protein